MRLFNKFTLNIGILCAFFCLLANNSAHAVDRIVQELGPTGTFSSITGAVNAASDGDRIIIFIRAGGLPWQENVTVGKSLVFLPAIDGIRFLVIGDWTIAPTAPGKMVRIIGMENLGGDIKANSSAPAGTRTQVEIAGCDLTGDLEFDQDYYDMTIASNRVREGSTGFDGTIIIRHGNVYGNNIDDFISVRTDAIPSNEIFDVIGNTCGRISWESNAHFFRIANNNVRFITTSSGRGLDINNVKNSAVEVNTVENNSVFVSSNTNFVTVYAIEFSNVNAPNATINALNNAMSWSGTTSPTTRGMFASTSATYSLFAAYNHVSTSFDIELDGIAVGLNVINFSLTLSAAGLPTGGAVLDGGHPGNDYIDHDLSRNDPGCYGGSFNITNYSVAAAPMIFHVETPRTVLQGSTLNVTSEGYDR